MLMYKMAKGAISMNFKTNSSILIIISIMIIIFTEIVGISMPIAFNYLQIFFAIITIIFFNLKLKEKTDKKNLVIINIIIIVANIALTNIISGYFKNTSVLAVLIFCKNIDKIDNIQCNKKLIKNIMLYYIIPLVVLLGIDVGYSKLVSEMPIANEYVMVHYNFVAMQTIYEIVMANIVMIMLGIVFKEIINSKMVITTNSKRMMIIFNSILALILCIKIILGYASIKDAKFKISKLNNAVESNNLNTYYEIDFEPNVALEEMVLHDNMDILSFNRILRKNVSRNAEIFYKVETSGIQDRVNDRTMRKNEALQQYNTGAINYIGRLEVYKNQLAIQNIANFSIYLIDIICIFIVYKKMKNMDRNEEYWQ